MSVHGSIMLVMTLVFPLFIIFSLGNIVAEKAAMLDRAERQSKRQEARDGEPVLVEVAIPLECIGSVICDFDGIYHIQVFGEDVVTDEETYQRVVEARDAHRRRMRELEVEVDSLKST